MIDFPPADLDLFLALAACLAAGMVRGFAGFGTSLILMSSVSALYTPALALPLMILTDAVGTVPLLPRAFRRANWREVVPMVLMAGVFLPVGVWVLVSVDPVLMADVIAILVLVATLVLASGWRYRGAPRLPVTLSVGAFSGFINGTAGLGAPPITLFWLAGQSAVETVRANMFTFFALLNVVSIPTMALNGLFTPLVFGMTLAAIPLYALGLQIGQALFDRSSERFFRRIAFTVILAIALVSFLA
ncbi:MAG: sulfite exporter TauE/SafE family protein [Azospirillaceae bacterium]